MLPWLRSCYRVIQSFAWAALPCCYQGLWPLGVYLLGLLQWMVFTRVWRVQQATPELWGRRAITWWVLVLGGRVEDDCPPSSHLKCRMPEDWECFSMDRQVFIHWGLGMYQAAWWATGVYGQATHDGYLCSQSPSPAWRVLASPVLSMHWLSRPVPRPQLWTVLTVGVVCCVRSTGFHGSTCPPEVNVSSFITGNPPSPSHSCSPCIARGRVSLQTLLHTCKLPHPLNCWCLCCWLQVLSLAFLNGTGTKRVETRWLQPNKLLVSSLHSFCHKPRVHVRASLFTAILRPYLSWTWSWLKACPGLA